ncbi:MAG: PEGA domain-containing protein [Verrucomicrobia bacterium]|nr:PEGA domain-containing protein [Verrucomicrobiota bacterium]
MKMNTVRRPVSSSLFRTRVILGSGLLAALLLSAGCVAPLPVTTTPAGATAIFDGKTLGPTPLQYTPEGNKPVAVEFRLDGYFPESFTFQPSPEAKGISAQLAPRTLTKSFDFTSAPDGATVAIDGKTAGTTPLTGLKVVFDRDDKTSPWKTKAVTVTKANYQSETVTLSADAAALPRVDLGLLREDRVYRLTAVNAEGAELNAEVRLDGKVVGQTPLKLPITFQRAVKTAPWPQFKVSAEIPAKYQPATATLDFARPTLAVGFKLEPVTEIVTTFTYPTLVMTPTGVTFRFQRTNAIAILNTREPAEIISDLKPVTNFGRQDVKDTASRAECINSFCVSPDGQNIIFSLTERDDQGGFYSNLSIKRADDVGGGVARLTQGPRYADTLPYIANDGSNYLVFASNRTDRTKPDIFRVNLVENRLSGGISRLTNDSRYNFGPSYGDSNRQLFYLSTEPNFPTAESQISSIRLDGSLPTQLSITALELNNVFAEKVYFVRLDEDSKKKQIYSITADGKLETALLNQEDFRTSNCFNPSVSPDGTRVLFVSDHGTDDQGRHNNDIYLVNADGTNLQRLTHNGSDDLMPAWSFSEEGVIFFLSNRGGAYNVWRLKVSGAK